MEAAALHSPTCWDYLMRVDFPLIELRDRVSEVELPLCQNRCALMGTRARFPVL